MVPVYNMDASFDASMLEGSSCAFGVFDGVHLGHRFLLDAAAKTAADSPGASIALTFDIDPDEMFHSDRLKKLMDNSERIEALASSGVDAVCVIPFTEDFAKEPPEMFLDRTFSGRLPAHLHVGRDIRFGARASGTADDLALWAQTHGMELHAHDLVSIAGSPVTSTRIRLLLLDGDVEAANELLGHPYALSEVVRAGRGEGTSLGFATANLILPGNRHVLGDGVYAGYTLVDGLRYRAAIAVGKSPLFADDAAADVEVHILDFEGDLYGRRITVEFLSRLRPMVAFDSAEELARTVADNISWVRENVPLVGA